ncbi:MAG: class IV adenylate cyclase [Candidatus Lokiarchaeota archaeon]|nr:class IV adenylate cyclase [Candidatus Lokiarchaeota archaeon]
MYEVEIKVRIQDLDEIREIIQFNGGSYKISLLHEDLYFNMPKELRDFKKTDEAIRLRKSEEFDKNNNDFLLKSKCYLTYKGKKIDTITKTRQEIEVKIDNFDNMKSILKVLGFQEVLSIHKERELFELLYQDEKIEILLDYIPLLNQYFMELEMVVSSTQDIDEARGILFKLLEIFNVNKDESIRKSYLELIVEKQEIKLKKGLRS